MFFYIALYLGLVGGLDFPPIEIKNECRSIEGVNGGSCERKFDVPTYFEDVKMRMNKIPRNQTVIEKLAGVTPDLFKYSVGFKDGSYVKIWSGQNSELWKDSRGSCPFPRNNFIETETGGYYIETSGLDEVPMRLRELATAFNDCLQWTTVFPRKIDKLERTERYDVYVKLGLNSYLSLLVLSISLTVFMLGMFKFLYKFIVEDLSK